ncbi:MAG: clan AA aspartic protease [Candidatus Omnitrophota bacterium]|jgi:clan AA aspartic protease|nr:MAG: clan AA aspartic protease [Candidatus Omnitrophota bacterium]
MIQGVVNRNLEAAINLLVRGPGGQEKEIEAVIDTGFNGFLTISPVLIRQLDLPHIGQTRALLANGKIEILDLYEVTLQWDDHWLTVESDAADMDVLVGMSLLNRFGIHVQVFEGGHVVIEALPGVSPTLFYA